MTLPRLTEWKRLAQSHRTRLDQFPIPSPVFTPLHCCCGLGPIAQQLYLIILTAILRMINFLCNNLTQLRVAASPNAPLKCSQLQGEVKRKEGGGGPEGLEKFFLTKNIARTHIPVCLKLTTENVCCKANYHL